MRSERVVLGRWSGLCGVVCVLFAASASAGVPSADSTPELQQLLDQTRRELQRLDDHARGAAHDVARLQQRLVAAEERNLSQVERIESMDRELERLRAQSSSQRRQWRQRVFEALQANLPVTPLAYVDGDRLIIPTDPVFVFGTGELGAEGRERLQPVARALVAALNELPADVDWRLEVAGHTDRRPLRGDARFADNWELSAARAVEVLRYLHAQGVASPRLAAVGFGASAPRDQAINKAAHRRNRRVEIRLDFPERRTASN